MPAVVVAVVATVNVLVTAAVPVTLADVGENEHVGVLTAPVGEAVTAQLNATLPVKPLLGVTVSVDVPLAPGDAIAIAGALSVKLAAPWGPVPLVIVIVAEEGW